MMSLEEVSWIWNIFLKFLEHGNVFLSPESMEKAYFVKPNFIVFRLLSSLLYLVAKLEEDPPDSKSHIARRTILEE